MITVQNLCKAYTTQEVFDDCNIVMNPGERLGFVGRNGHGKTTLFRLLLGEEKPDTGSITMPRGYTIGHLSQHLHFEKDNILDEVTSVLGERVAEEGYRAEAALMGLGFSVEDLTRPASEFSGGYQIRINLARVLVEQPNLLLLDEPTNYLDILSVRWLQRFLREWRNELIIISHDRQFMNSVTTHTMAIHRRKLRRIIGPVEKLFGQISSEEEIYENTRLNEQKKRRQEERFIERFRSKASKATLVQSRIKALAKRGEMEALGNEQDLAFKFTEAPFHSTTMMTIEDLAFGYEDGPTLIERLSLTIDKGDRVAIIGPNGKGKTTLLNLLAKELQPKSGQIKSNPNTSIAYFGQTNIARLDSRNTVEEELLASQPNASRSAVRGLCGLLMFSGDTALKKVDVLSGGEKSRVLLGKLLASPANMLMLDEPTNHLDIESVEGLLDAVDIFDGSVLLVTHSEMVLERLATRLVIFDGGKVTLFEGGYRDFMDRIGWQNEVGAKPNRKITAKKNAKEVRRLRADIFAERSKATSPQKKAVEKTEKRIEQLEEQITVHDKDMAVAAEAGRNDEIREINARAKQKRQQVDELFGKLEKLIDTLEVAKSAFDERLAALD
ncbi:MAG: ATP-binding cassette subfamily F protein 3 [Pseudohongiellaceae bacterium]|jgi:ATP-binding cassette subfamily F protein 3